MMRDNHFYGHAAILRAYCGVRLPLPIAGRLQHGWNYRGGLHEQYLLAPYPKFVWSQRNADYARLAGYRNVFAIGAPLLYLPPEAATSPHNPKRLLAFPPHRTELRQIIWEPTEYAASLEQLRADGFGPITVCLYYLDHADPALREFFLSRGFDVTTVGPRNRNPGFLWTLRRLILDHGYVTSNEIGTAGFYALALGRTFFIHGPRSETALVSLPGEQRLERSEAPEFPELAYARLTEHASHAALWRAELGAEHMKTPEELRALLGWNVSSAHRQLVVAGQHLTYTAQRRIAGIPRPA